MNRHYSMFIRAGLLLVLLGMVFPAQFTVFAAASLTITPITWNVIGLDSNNVNVGPNHFPAGARVCNTGDAPATNLNAGFIWDSSNPLINIRPGTSSTLSQSSLAAGACTDFYFEVEVTRDAAAYDTTRNYHITVTADGGLSVSTPMPRSLYVEHLISQNRNSVTDMQFGTSPGSLTSIPNGGTMTLMVGNTYYIRLIGNTATQGYEQIESFINFPNTIFQILSVDTTYTAESSATLNPPYDKLYGDGCVWENDPASANYRACLSTGKAGGDITVTYRVKILQVPSSPLVNPEPLSTLIYDFSGSSYHYNSDYGVSTRYANIVTAGIVKSFSPKTINPGVSSTLTFTINNPGPEPLTGVNFNDTLPAGMTISNTTVTYTGCGSPSPASLVVGATSLSFSSITVGGLGTCVIGVNVTSATLGTHTNTSGNLFINTSVDTGNFAIDSLLVSSTPNPPASCSTRTTMAAWNLENYTAATSTNNGPFAYSSKQSDVSTAAGTYVSATGSSSGIADTATFPAGWGAPSSSGSSGNSWGIQGGWPSSNPATPETAITPYFQFQVDASQYGGVGISASYNMQGNWSNSGNWYVLFSTDGSTWSSAGSSVWDKSNSWKTGASGISVTTSSTGNSTVYFRVFAAGAQYSGNPSSTTGTFYLDDIQLNGCQLPQVPTLSKAFTPSSVAKDSTSTLTFTITNPNATSALSGVGFEDTLPTGLLIANPNGLVTACAAGTFTGATITATSGTTPINVSGGTLSAGADCTISVDVLGNVAGQYDNVSGNITSTETGPNTTSSGYGTSSLTVVAPPVIAKSFTANPIFTGNSTTLTFSITNPNASTTLTGISFTDTLPAGLDVVNTSSSQCGGTLTATDNSPLQDTVSLSGGSLAAGGSCSFNVTVTGSTIGLKANSVTVSSTSGGTGNTSTANVLVRDPAPGINLLKQVGPSSSGPWTPSLSVNLPGNVYYKFTVENVGDVSLTSVNLTDPSLTSPSPSTCSWVDGDGTALSAPFNLPVADANDNQLAICVLGPVTGVVGTNPNTATASGTYNAVPVSDDSMATYTGTGIDLTVTKTNDTAGVGAVEIPFTWTLTIANGGTSDAVFADGNTIVSDPLPVNATYGSPTAGSFTNITNPGNISCAIAFGTLNCTASGGSVTLGAGTGSFTVSFSATPTAAGSLANTATVDPDNNITEGSETNNSGSDTVIVLSPPAISKNFSPDPINVGGISTLTFTIINSNAGTALAGVAFSDPLPAGLQVASLPSASSSSCGTPTFAPAASDTTLTFTGGTIAASGSCTVSVDVTATTSGLKNNTTGNVTSANGGTGNAANDTLQVNSPSLDVVKEVATTAGGPWDDTSVTVTVGDTVYYRIRVLNTGNITLTNLVVDDGMAGCTLTRGTDLTGNNDADFEVGEEWLYTCSMTAVAGTNNNTATADTDETTQDSDNASYFGKDPSLNVIKEVAVAAGGPWNDTSITVNVGDTVYYRIRVSNTGNITLTNLAVDDGMAGCTLTRGTDLTGNNDTNFEAGEEWLYTCSVMAVSGTNNNTATADTDETPQDSDDASYTANLIAAPGMNVIKDGTLDMTVIAPNSRADAGDLINYTVSVQNTGNVVLTGVIISDPLLANLDCDGTVGAPYTTSGLTINVATTLTCTGSYTLTQNDLDSNGGGDGDIDNTAVADSNETGPESDPNEETLPLAPAIDVAKTLDSSTFNSPNEVRLTYSITVQNTGNVTLTNVQVTDDLVAAFPGAASFSVFSVTSGSFSVNPGFNGTTDTSLLSGTDSLAVGASGSVTLVVDVDTGGDEDFYVNTAAGSGFAPDGSTVQDNGVAAAPGFVDPALTKAANVSQASVGDTVTFTITVTNEGNTPAPNVIVTDTLPAVFDVIAVNVSMAGPALVPVVNVVPAIGVGPAPYTVTVNLGTLQVTNVVTIQIATTVNSLGNPPIVNNTGLTTSALTNNPLNDNDSVALTLGIGPTTSLSLPATGFAPGRATVLDYQPENLRYAATDVILEIPRLGLRMPIVGVPFKNGGWDVSWLGNQAGWLEGSAFPSWNGNSVLTGHVYSASGSPGPFLNLGTLKYGDRVTVHANGLKYIFEIRSNSVVAPRDSSAFKHEELSWLTLITCKEYDPVSNSYKMRVVVRAVLVGVE